MTEGTEQLVGQGVGETPARPARPVRARPVPTARDGPGCTRSSGAPATPTRSPRRRRRPAGDRAAGRPDHADGEAGQVHVVGAHGSGVLGRLAAEQRAPGLAATVGNAIDHLGHPPGVEPTHRPRSRGRRAARRRHTPRRPRRTWPPGRSPPCRSGRSPWRSRALVPTPSVADTSTGRRYRLGSKANSPAKLPMSPTTSGRAVARALSRIRRTASSPAAMDTPDPA